MNPETGEDTHTPNLAAIRNGERPMPRKTRDKMRPGTYCTIFVSQDIVDQWKFMNGESLGGALVSTVIQDNFMDQESDARASWWECTDRGFKVHIRVKS